MISIISFWEVSTNFVYFYFYFISSRTREREREGNNHRLYILFLENLLYNLLQVLFNQLHHIIFIIQSSFLPYHHFPIYSLALSLVK